MPTAHARGHRVLWNSLPDELQLDLAGQALIQAAAIIAGQAECLASEMEDGALADQGGPDALRLLAAVVRATTQKSSAIRSH